MRNDQKGARRNHGETRKPLPGDRSISIDRLTREDRTLVMSQVTSKPRAYLALTSPSRISLAAISSDAHAIMDTPGIEELSLKGSHGGRIAHGFRSQRGTRHPSVYLPRR